MSICLQPIVLALVASRDVPIVTRQPCFRLARAGQTYEAAVHLDRRSVLGCLKLYAGKARYLKLWLATRDVLSVGWQGWSTRISDRELWERSVDHGAMDDAETEWTLS